MAAITAFFLLLAELDNGESEETETDFDCKIQHYPARVDDELTAQQVLSRLQNQMVDSVTAKKRIHELEENNARLKKEHAEEREAHATTKKELAWEKEARIADVKEWKAWHARNIPRVDRILAEEKEKNASLKKKLAQSNKANEDLCAGLYSAKEKNAETNRMLSDLAKVSDKQDTPQITET